jgi:hypothetical protein
MKAKAALSLLLLGALTAALLLPHGTAAAKGRKPLTVGKDAKGDWGENAGAPELAPLGAALGQDLVSAAIGIGKKKTINFIIKVTSLPPVGGTPEATRYNWDFTVDGKAGAGREVHELHEGGVRPDLWAVSTAARSGLRAVLHPGQLLDDGNHRRV